MKKYLIVTLIALLGFGVFTPVSVEARPVVIVRPSPGPAHPPIFRRGIRMVWEPGHYVKTRRGRTWIEGRYVRAR